LARARSYDPRGGDPTVVFPVSPLSAPADWNYLRSIGANIVAAHSLLQVDDEPDSTGHFFQQVGAHQRAPFTPPTTAGPPSAFNEHAWADNALKTMVWKAQPDAALPGLGSMLWSFIATDMLRLQALWSSQPFWRDAGRLTCVLCAACLLQMRRPRRTCWPTARATWS
jgi:hypothetical protein